MNRRSFFSALLGALALPLLKPGAHRATAPAAVVPKRARQFPTLVVSHSRTGLDCIAVSLLYDHHDDSLDAPVVMSVERYMNAWKSVAWAEARGTPVVVNRWLAHALVERATVGKYVPQSLYAPLAQIVARLTPYRGAGNGNANGSRTSANPSARKEASLV